MTDDNETRHRVVLLGAGRVGKTSIISRFLNGTFPHNYKQTVEDLHCRNYNIKGTVIKMDLLDTAGNYEFPAMRRLCISNAHAFVLVYSVDLIQSFPEVKAIYEQVREQREDFQNIPCVIVANKIDLDESKRAVSITDVQDWIIAENIESRFIEVSALEDTAVLQIFQKLLDQANIPQLRQVEPILRRKLSAKDSRSDKLKREEGKLSRSRSLIRRATKPKLKQNGDPMNNDCVIC